MFSEITRIISRYKAVMLFKLLIAGFLFEAGCVPASYEGNAGSEEPVNDVQYLQSYGEWFDVPPYGSVWQPFVVSGWAPFYHGHWIWTNDGWAWVSYEPFGWLVYHYGFWDYQRGIGWFWVPGDAWSPARVQWYTFDDYCAWAPLPPPDAYWPAPWEPFDIDVWIVVDINSFTDDDIGRLRITKPLPRELAKREALRDKPPDIRIIREREKKSLTPVILRKEPVDIRTLPYRVQPKPIAPRDSSLERMILPPTDKQKVDRYAPEVKREVLAPRKPSPPPEQKPPEKKADEESTKTPRRR